MPRFVRLPGECSRRALSVLAVVGLVVCLCGCCGGLATAERPPTVVRTRLPGRTIAVGLHLCGACLLDDRTFSAPRSKETLVALLPADLVVGVRTVRAVVLDTASGRQADVTATVRRNSTIGVFGRFSLFFLGLCVIGCSFSEQLVRPGRAPPRPTVTFGGGWSGVSTLPC